MGNRNGYRLLPPVSLIFLLILRKQEFPAGISTSTSATPKVREEGRSRQSWIYISTFPTHEGHDSAIPLFRRHRKEIDADWPVCRCSQRSFGERAARSGRTLCLQHRAISDVELPFLSQGKLLLRTVSQSFLTAMSNLRRATSPPLKVARPAGGSPATMPGLDKRSNLPGFRATSCSRTARADGS